MGDGGFEHYPGGATRAACRPCRFIADGRTLRASHPCCPKCGAELTRITVFHRQRRAPGSRNSTTPNSGSVGIAPEDDAS